MTNHKSMIRYHDGMTGVWPLHAVNTTAGKTVWVFLFGGLQPSSEYTLELSEANLSCGDIFITRASTQQGVIGYLAALLWKVNPFQNRTEICFNGNVEVDFGYAIFLIVCNYFVDSRNTLFCLNNTQL